MVPDAGWLTCVRTGVAAVNGNFKRFEGDVASSAGGDRSAVIDD